MFIVLKKTNSKEENKKVFKFLNQEKIIYQRGESADPRAVFIADTTTPKQIFELDKLEEVEKITESLTKNEMKLYGTPFFPHHLLKEIIVGFLVFGLLVFLACFLPAQIHEPANPMVTKAHIKPEWYFLAVYQALKYIPTEGVIPFVFLFQAFLGGLIVLIPFIDRTKTTKGFRIVQIIGALCVLLFIMLTLMGYFSPFKIDFLNINIH